MKLTACMIVKNEARCLSRCLASLQGHVDEIVVVDTGSTDATVEIATSFGAQVYHFEWVNNFALARNFAIDHCTGDWLFIIDADEYLRNGDASVLRSLCEQADVAHACALIISQVSYTAGTVDETLHGTAQDPVALGQTTPYLVAQVQRVLKRRDDIRYSGALHEFAVFTHDPSLPLPYWHAAHNAVVLYHDGYTPALSAQKKERNAAIINEAQEERPHTWFNRGRANWGIVMMSPTLDRTLAQKVLDDLSTYIHHNVNVTLGDFLYPHHMYIELAIRLETSEQDMMAIADLGVSVYPTIPRAYLLRATVSHHFDRRSQMCDDVARALAAQKHYHNPHDSYVPNKLYATLQHACGMYFEAIGEHRAACVQLAGSLRATKAAGRAMRDETIFSLVNNTFTLKDTETVALLSEFATTTPDLQRLVDTLRRTRPDVVFLTFFEKLYTLTKTKDSNFFMVQIVLEEYVTAKQQLLTQHAATGNTLFLCLALVADLLQHNGDITLQHPLLDSCIAAYNDGASITTDTTLVHFIAATLLALRPHSAFTIRWCNIRTATVKTQLDIADLLRNRRLFSEALTMYTQALESLPDNVALQESIVYCSYRTKDMATLADFSRQLVQCNPKSTFLRNVLEWTLSQHQSETVTATFTEIQQQLTC